MRIYIIFFFQAIDELSLFSPIYQEVGTETFESLLYGETNLNTQLLFTIGRAEKNDNNLERLDKVKNYKQDKKIPDGCKKHNPMLKYV